MRLLYLMHFEFSLHHRDSIEKRLPPRYENSARGMRFKERRPNEHSAKIAVTLF